MYICHTFFCGFSSKHPAHIILQEIEGEAEGEVQLIDFEYSDFTYRSFDIANHFNEYAGFECDYSRFPDSSHIAHFLRQYLEEGTTQPVVRVFCAQSTQRGFENEIQCIQS